MKNQKTICRLLAFMLMTKGIPLFATGTNQWNVQVTHVGSYLMAGGAADTNQWKFQVTRLVIASPPAIVKKKLTGKVIPDEIRRDIENYRQHNGWSPGVTVNLRVTAPERQIVGSYFSEATITSFTDDKGKNLLPDNKDDGLLHPAEGIVETVHTRGTPVMSVEVKSSKLPSKGATELKLVGKVVVKTASQSKELPKQNIKLQAGSKFDLGDLQVTVSDIGMEHSKFVVTLDADHDLMAIASLEVFNKQGKRIDASLSDSTDFRDVKKHMVTLSERRLTLDKRLDSATIKATCWTDLKTTEVPIDAKVGLGL